MVVLFDVTDIAPQFCVPSGTVVATRDLGACDVVEGEFLKLGRDTGLVADLGRRDDDDVEHIIRWAMLDQNPFQ